MMLFIFCVVFIFCVSMFVSDVVKQVTGNNSVYGTFNLILLVSLVCICIVVGVTLFKCGGL